MNLPAPTPEMLRDPRYEAIWKAIRDWRIGMPGGGVSEYATTAHARAILEAIDDDPSGWPTFDQLLDAVVTLAQKHRRNNPDRPTKVHFTPLGKKIINRWAKLNATYQSQPNKGKEFFAGLEIVSWNADALRVE